MSPAVFPRSRAATLVLIRRLVVVEDQIRKGVVLDGAKQLFGCERARELDEHRAQVRAVAQQVSRPAPARKQKRRRREIAFGGVTTLTGEHEIIASIVRSLSASRRHVIEGHAPGREAIAAVCADGAVLLQQPGACVRVGGATGWVRGQLWLSGVR